MFTCGHKICVRGTPNAQENDSVLTEKKGESLFVKPEPDCHRDHGSYRLSAYLFCVIIAVQNLNRHVNTCHAIKRERYENISLLKVMLLQLNCNTNSSG